MKIKSFFLFIFLTSCFSVFAEDSMLQIKSLPYDMMQICFANKTNTQVKVFLNTDEKRYEIPAFDRCETESVPIKETSEFSITLEFENGAARTFWFNDTDHWFNIQHYYYFIIDAVDDIWYFEDRTGKEYESYDREKLFSEYSMNRWYEK